MNPRFRMKIPAIDEEPAVRHGASLGGEGGGEHDAIESRALQRTHELGGQRAAKGRIGLLVASSRETSGTSIAV